MLKILLVGSAAREHAIARAIKKSTIANQLYCYGPNSNPGILALTEKFIVSEIDKIAAIVAFAQQERIDFAIIGPEAPLELGLVDKLLLHNIKVIGPTKKLAQIETSKGFTRDLLKKYKIDALPVYKNFSNLTGVKNFLNNLNNDYVIKADGLMSGKGVKLSGEHLHNLDAAINYCQELLTRKQAFVIEEKFYGEEFSLISFSDGKTLVHMPPVQDHKRAFIDDQGPNTGGMGSYSAENHLLPFLNTADLEAAAHINETAIKALQEETQEKYKGIIYGGYILTKNGIKLIEFNARFGDPEAINLLALLKTDFLTILQAIITGNLDKIKIEFVNFASVCKYIVPNGYPDKAVTDQHIDVSSVKEKENLYYAQINTLNNKMTMGTSRAIAVLGLGNNIFAAEKKVMRTIKEIKGDIFYRADIGTSQLINKRIININKICKRNNKLC